MVRTMKTLIAVALATLALAGCSSGPGHNTADVSFAQEMIPHHQQAISMSTTAAKRGGPAVRKLAAQIRAAQAPEIRLMTGWLNDWNAPTMEHDTGHGMDMGATGMLDEAALENLSKAEGRAFDTLWLRGMIQHHQGAISMAEDEIASGEFPKAVAMARSIVKTQEAEIERMQEMLK